MATAYTMTGSVMNTTMCIYIVTNTINNKSYVGKSVRSLRSRWSQHVSKAVTNRNKSAMAAAIVKYGRDVFDVRVLEVCASREELVAAEKKWIADLDTLAPRGYNLTSGGDGGYRFPDDVIKRIAEASKGRRASIETRAKLSAAQREIQNDPERKAKTIAMLTGRACSPSTREKISSKQVGIPKPRGRVLDQARLRMKGRVVVCETGEKYLSFMEACEATGFKKVNLFHAATGRQKTCGGLKFWMEPLAK